MRASRIVLTAAAAMFAVTLAGAQTPDQINTALKAAYDKYKGLKEGANADYIPALAKVDSNIYGIALVTTDGKVYTTGDIKSEVSIQSISKVFTLAKVIEEQGPAAIANSIGVDATG
ncbi:MAG TPA: glutaminase, partial [Candidatus Polarisedimenticolaceae bacterium]|nr:glutaminase [Candidatus Polarisedimenticolaceae bacterium]